MMGALTVVVSLASLLLESGSGWSALTVAALVMFVGLVTVGAVTTMAIVTRSPFAMLPTEQVKMPPSRSRSPCEGSADLKVVPDGRSFTRPRRSPYLGRGI